MHRSQVQNVFSIDVEEWFHLYHVYAENALPMHQWCSLESRVEMNMDRLLVLLDSAQVQCTCFVLGWIAEHYPDLVRRIASAGHEVSSHGYGHQPVFDLNPVSFRSDLDRSIETIRAAADRRPAGYRAPFFSIKAATKWAFDVIAEAGFTFDSSVFPAPREAGGIADEQRLIHRRCLENGRDLLELPISTTRLGGRFIPYCGGGYLRALPYRFIASRVRQANRRGESVVVYIHPRDIDPEQPRWDLPWRRRFKYYFNLDTTAGKLEELLKEFPFTTASAVLDEYAQKNGATG